MDLQTLLGKTYQELLDDPTILKVSKGFAQSRQMSMRKDHAWRIASVDQAINARAKA